LKGMLVRGVILTRLNGNFSFIWEDWKHHCHRYNVKLDSEGNDRGVVLNLALVISTLIGKFEGKSLP